jgi:hypothetical protein
MSSESMLTPVTQVVMKLERRVFGDVQDGSLIYGPSRPPPAGPNNRVRGRGYGRTMSRTGVIRESIDLNVCRAGTDVCRAPMPQSAKDDMHVCLACIARQRLGLPSIIALGPLCRYLAPQGRARARGTRRAEFHSRDASEERFFYKKRLWNERGRG